MDADLRDLERRAAQGDVDAGAQLLRARVQSGELSVLDVRLRAVRQDPAAKALVGGSDLGGRARLARLDAEIQRRRAALGEEERGELDRRFYRAFVRATLGPPGPSTRTGDPAALAELRELLEQGASTSAFEDYELGDDNFGTIAREWLDRSYRPGTADADMAEAFGLCIEAGPAFVTNRGYVGNGGAPAIWFVFEWFAQHDDPERAPFVQGLLEAMCAAAEPKGPFWTEFFRSFLYGFLERVRRRGKPLSEAQGRLARFGLELVLDPPDLETGLANWKGSEWFGNHVSTVGGALLGLGDPGLFEVVFRLAGEGAGVFGQSLSVSYEAAEPLLKAALKDGRTRSALGKQLRQSKWLRAASFACPELIFSLVRRRERKLLKVLLDVERGRMRALRDAEGNDLLLAACGAKGRTEKIVQLLLKRGFDPQVTNAKGEGALDLANRARNKKLIALLSERG